MSNQNLHAANLRSKIAGGTITAYYFVELGTGGVVTVCNGAGDKPYGVAQHAASSGEPVLIAVSGETKVSSDAALSVGDLVGPSGDGQADAKVPATDDNEYYCGIVTKATVAAGGMAEVELFGMVYLDKNT